MVRWHHTPHPIPHTDSRILMRSKGCKRQRRAEDENLSPEMRTFSWTSNTEMNSLLQGSHGKAALLNAFFLRASSTPGRKIRVPFSAPCS
jgi:hypothetical protein